MSVPKEEGKSQNTDNPCILRDGRQSQFFFWEGGGDYLGLGIKGKGEGRWDSVG